MLQFAPAYLFLITPTAWWPSCELVRAAARAVRCLLSRLHLLINNIPFEHNVGSDRAVRLVEAAALV